MNDVIAATFSAGHIRDWTVALNVVSAFFIGPYLAFAATPDAGFRCFQALIRMIHRIVLVCFAISLMYNATVIVNTDRIPSGSALAINICIFASVLISALRYKFWMGDIPADASWSRPHFPFRKSNAQAASEAATRRAR